MQQIFDSSALSIFPLSDGMIFAYCQDRDGDLMTVAFKSISFEDGKMINVTSDYFSIAKFGAQYKSLLFQVENPVTCKVAYLPNGNTFIADKWASVHTDIRNPENWSFYTGSTVLKEHVLPQ